MKKIEVYQEWEESEDSKTGWVGLGWQYVETDEPVSDNLDVIITDEDKFYNPIKGYIEYDDGSQDDYDLTEEQIAEIRRRVADLEDPVRYLIRSKIITFVLWHNVENDTWANDIEYGTLYKREKHALAVRKMMRDNDTISIIKVTVDEDDKIIKIFENN